jgi:hypothetical protein
MMVKILPELHKFLFVIPVLNIQSKALSPSARAIVGCTEGQYELSILGAR